MADVNGVLLDLPVSVPVFGSPQSIDGIYQPGRNLELVVTKVYFMRGINSQTGAWVFWTTLNRPSLSPFPFTVLYPTVTGVTEMTTEQ